MGGARHLGTAFLSCRFDRATLFDAAWEGCKLTGSHFPARSSGRWRRRTVTGADLLRGVDLSGLDLSGQRFREADFTDADLRECDLTGADLDRSRPAGSQAARRRPARRVHGRGELAGFEVTGVRLDLVQTVQFARAHGALVAD